MNILCGHRSRQLHPVQTRRNWLCVVISSMLLLIVGGHAASAQLDAACDAMAASWARSLSFGTLTDVGLPGPTMVPQGQYFASVPMIGLATTAANPAGLAQETVSARTEIGVGGDAVRGGYRRPLDDGASRRARISFAGAEPLRPGTAISGGAAIQRESVDGGSRALFVAPYSSNPFVPSDTNNPQLSRPSVCLHGAEATEIGQWSTGVAVAYRVLDNTSVHSAIAALGRRSSSAASAGVTRSMGSVRAGIVIRGITAAQTTTVIANPGSARAYALNGYENVPPQDISVVAEPFFRREDVSGGAVGFNGVATVRGMRIAGFWELQSRHAHQFGTLLTNPPTDIWNTNGYTSGAAAQTPVIGILATVHANYTAATGRTVRADTVSGEYGSSASMLTFGVDVRRSLLDSTWALAASLDIMRLHQRATDTAAFAFTNVTTWQPELLVALTRQLHSKRAVTLGAGFSHYATRTELPAPTGRGQPYESLIAPAIEIAAAPAAVGQVMLGWSSILFGRSVCITPFYDWMRPMRAPSPEIPLPRGDRKRYGFLTAIATSR